MKNNKIIVFVILMGLIAFEVQAGGLYGSPVSVTEPGKFSAKLEGSIVRNREISVDDATLYATVGAVPLSLQFSEDNIDVDEEQVGLGLAYSISQTTEIFGSISQGVQSMSGSGNSDSHSAYRAGVKFVPKQSGPLKFGFMVQVSQSSTSYEGEYQPSLNFQSPTTNYIIWSPIQAKEEIEITSFNALFGMGYVMPSAEPYFGLSFSQVSGTYKFSANDTINVDSYPISGGPITTNLENVTLNYEPDIKTTNYFEVIAGVRFKTDINMFFDLEAHFLLQKGVLFEIGYIF